MENVGFLMVMRNILWPCGNFVAIWYIFAILVVCQEKSGNPE
jgi:hypothetical protein